MTAPLSVALPVMASISTAASVADTLPITSVSASFSVTLAPLAVTSPVKSLPVFATLTASFAVKSAVVPRTFPVRLICPCSASTSSAEPALPTAPAPVTPVLPDRIVFASPATEPVLATSIAPPFAVTARSRPAVTSGNKMSPLPDSIVMSFPADRASAVVNVPFVAIAVKLPFSTLIPPFKTTFVPAVKTTSPLSPVTVTFVAVRFPPAIAVTLLPDSTSPSSRFPLAVADTYPACAVTFPSSRSPLPDLTITLFPTSRSCAVVNVPPVAVAVRLPFSTDTTPFKARSVAAVRVTSPPVAVMFVAVRCPPAVAVMPFPAVTSPRFRSLLSVSSTLPRVAVAVTAPPNSFAAFVSTMSPFSAVNVLAPVAIVSPVTLTAPAVDSNSIPRATISFAVRSPPALTVRLLVAKSCPDPVKIPSFAVRFTSPKWDVTLDAVRLPAAVIVTLDAPVTSDPSTRSFASRSAMAPFSAIAVTAPPKSLPVFSSTISPFFAVSVLAPPTATNPSLCCAMPPPCAVTVRPSSPAITVCNEMSPLFEEMSTPLLPLMRPSRTIVPFVAASVTIFPSTTPFSVIVPPLRNSTFPTSDRIFFSPAKVKSPAVAVSSMFPEAAVRLSASVMFVAARAVKPFAASTEANAMSPPAVMATCAPACHMPSACWMSLAAYNVMAVGSTLIVSGASPPVVTTEVPFVNPSVAMVMSPPSV